MHRTNVCAACVFAPKALQTITFVAKIGRVVSCMAGQLTTGVERLGFQ
jgi:hypothetical protein